MIQLSNFTMGYGQRVLISSASCEFPQGQLTALVGRNGSGKSTLLRAIAGINRGYKGEIKLSGTEMLHMSHKKRATELAFVATRRTRIPSLRCREVVAAGRSPYTNWLGSLTANDEKKVFKALSDVGMASFAEQTLDTLSDGECQRIMVARALAQDTPIIILDEPTSFLDVVNRRELCALLATLAHDDGKCIVFSTHELELAHEFCDNIALIHHSRLTIHPIADYEKVKRSLLSDD